jgi:hypothetical protein
MLDRLFGIARSKRSARRGVEQLHYERLSQSLHQIVGIEGPLSLFGRFDGFAGGLALDECDEILRLRRIKMPRPISRMREVRLTIFLGIFRRIPSWTIAWHRVPRSHSAEWSEHDFAGSRELDRRRSKALAGINPCRCMPRALPTSE